MAPSFASRLGTEHPLIQAPMSGSTPPAASWAAAACWRRKCSARRPASPAPAGLPYPVLNALSAPLRRAAAEAGRGDLLSEWCGQAAGLVRPQPAAELVAWLMHEYRLARRSLAH